MTSQEEGSFMSRSKGVFLLVFTLLVATFVPTINAVAKTSQTISFTPPVAMTTQTVIDQPLTATASSGLIVGFASTTRSICSVIANAIHVISAGTCTITASQGGNATYAAARSVSRSIAIDKVAQTISFTPPVAMTTQTVIDQPLTATASSGLIVGFASTTRSICSVIANAIHVISAGTCTITASQGGNATYAAARSVNKSIAITITSITLTSQTISISSPVAMTTQTFVDQPLTATASSGLTVSFASTTPSTCSVISNAIHVISAGTCTIAISQGGDATYAAAGSVNISIAINQVPELSGLVLSSGLLSPGFESGITSYTATVAAETSVVTIAPSTPEASATIQVNGLTVVSGIGYLPISLNLGANTVTIVVTAQNGSTKTYTVVITRSPSSNTSISAFSFATPAVVGIVDNTAHTVNLSVPTGTNKTLLISVFTLATEATAKISTTDQVSGTTANDFTNPETYTITAQDGVTTQDYLVTVGNSILTPTISVVSKAAGPRIGGTPIAIVGSGFQSGATVKIGGLDATDVIILTENVIIALTPAHQVGAANVVVTNTDNSSVTGATQFTFNYVTCNGSFTCIVGDTGPGGGKIFYASAVGFNGGSAPCGSSCHYLEKAPLDTDAYSNNGGGAFIGYWGTLPQLEFNRNSPLNNYIGAGYDNTENLVAHPSSHLDDGSLFYSNDENHAPWFTRHYRAPNNDLSDWYLPNNGELIALLAAWPTIGDTYLGSFSSNTDQFSGAGFYYLEADGLKFWDQFNQAVTMDTPWAFIPIREF